TVGTVEDNGRRALPRTRTPCGKGQHLVLMLIRRVFWPPGHAPPCSPKCPLTSPALRFAPFPHGLFCIRIIILEEIQALGNGFVDNALLSHGLLSRLHPRRFSEVVAGGPPIWKLIRPKSRHQIEKRAFLLATQIRKPAQQAV